MLIGDKNRQPDKPVPGPIFDVENIGLVLFDLDGTLVDSVRDLAWCGNEMLRRLDLPQHDPGAARIWVGNGIERLVKRILTGDMHAEPDPALFDAGLEVFNRLYAEHVSERSVVYPDVIEALERISGLDLHLACVTNKPESFTALLLAAMRLDSYFELVVAGDTTARKKPDPMPLHYAADYFGLEYRECMMVGDSSNDVNAARAAGFAVVGVPYGYNHGIDIRESNPDRVVDNLNQLADMFTRGEP